jgi:hypothetical protein
LDSRGITKVWRVQNRRLWARYVDRRGEVASEVARHGGLIHAASWKFPSETSDEGGALVPEAGERLLFHGADPGAIVAIVSGGFECRSAQSSALAAARSQTPPPPVPPTQSPAWAARWVRRSRGGCGSRPEL